MKVHFGTGPRLSALSDASDNVLYHSLLGLASGESDFADKHSLNTVSGLQGALDRTKWRLYVQAHNFRLVDVQDFGQTRIRPFKSLRRESVET